MEPNKTFRSSSYEILTIVFVLYKFTFYFTSKTYNILNRSENYPELGVYLMLNTNYYFESS